MAREVKTSGRTIYLPDREEREETPTDPAPRAGPYALTVEVSGFVEHELRCSGCGEPQKEVPVAQQINGRHHFVAEPGGWRKCGEWR